MGRESVPHVGAEGMTPAQWKAESGAKLQALGLLTITERSYGYSVQRSAVPEDEAGRDRFAKLLREKVNMTLAEYIVSLSPNNPRNSPRPAALAKTAATGLRPPALAITGAAGQRTTSLPAPSTVPPVVMATAVRMPPNAAAVAGIARPSRAPQASSSSAYGHLFAGSAHAVCAAAPAAKEEIKEERDEARAAAGIDDEVCTVADSDPEDADQDGTHVAQPGRRKRLRRAV